MKKVFAWILLATMAATILVGCAPKEEAATPDAGATPAADGQAGGAKTPADDATAGQ